MCVDDVVIVAVIGVVVFYYATAPAAIHANARARELNIIHVVVSHYYCIVCRV